MEITLIVTKNTNQKLAFVKLIKEVSGLGLRDAKYFCDEAIANLGRPNKLTLFNKESYNELIGGLKNIDGSFKVTGGVEYQRNLNLLKLGIGKKEDYAELIKDECFVFGNEKMIDDIIGMLDMDSLVKLLNNINYERI